MSRVDEEEVVLVVVEVDVGCCNDGLDVKIVLLQEETAPPSRRDTNRRLRPPGQQGNIDLVVVVDQAFTVKGDTAQRRITKLCTLLIFLLYSGKVMASV